MGKKGRTPKALLTRGLGQHAANLKIKGLANGISSVFRKTFSVNKYEGKCNSYLFSLPISSVICVPISMPPSSNRNAIFKARSRKRVFRKNYSH